MFWVRAYCPDASIHAPTDTRTYECSDTSTHAPTDTRAYVGSDASDNGNASDTVTHAIPDHQTIQWRWMRQLRYVRGSAWQCPECK